MGASCCTAKGAVETSTTRAKTSPAVERPPPNAAVEAREAIIVSEATAAPHADASANNDSADLLQRLDDDVLLHVLSFVSTAPLETFSKTQRFYLHQNEEPLRLLRHYHQQGQQQQPNSIRWSSPYSLASREPTQVATAPEVATTPSSSTTMAKRDPGRFGTLTHVLPLVCRRFRDLCAARPLWDQAILRNLEEDETWKRAAQDVVDANRNRISGLLLGMDAVVADHDAMDESSPIPPQPYECIHELLTAARNALDMAGNQNGTMATQNCRNHNGSIMTGPQLYRHIYAHKAGVMPLFRMPSPSVRMGQTVELHFLEPRYRRMIHDLMVPYPVFVETNKEPDDNKISRMVDIPVDARPRFLWSCLPRVHEGAAMVEVVTCRLHADGTADVTVSPIAWTMVDEVITGDRHGLWYATLARHQKRSVLSVFQTEEAGWNSFLRSDRAFAMRMLETRDVRLVLQLMVEQHNFNNQRGNQEQRRRPRFVMTSSSDTCPAVARIVEMEDSQIRFGGSVDLVVAPTEWVLVESITKQQPDGLYRAQVLYMRAPPHHHHYGGFGGIEEDDDV